MVRKNSNQTTKAGEPDNAVMPETTETTDDVTLDEAGKDEWREQTREGIGTVMVNRDKVLIRVVVRASPASPRPSSRSRLSLALPPDLPPRPARIAGR